MNINEQPFQDKGLWQSKVASFKESYLQFEMNQPSIPIISEYVSYFEEEKKKQLLQNGVYRVNDEIKGVKFYEVEDKIPRELKLKSTVNINLVLSIVNDDNRNRIRLPLQQLAEWFENITITAPTPKYLSINANQAGVNKFLEQIKSLDVDKYSVNTTFTLEQEIEKRKLRYTGGYFDKHRLTDGEDHGYDVYLGGSNLTGYQFYSCYGTFATTAMQVLLKWYPAHKDRLMAVSLNYDKLQVIIHVNPEGYIDLMNIMNMYATLYYRFDIFVPLPRIIAKYGNSKFFLTNLPIDCQDDKVVHVNFYKDYELPNMVNIFTYEVFYENQSKYPLFLQVSPRGCLELESVFSTCLKQFEQVDYFDYQIDSGLAEYIIVERVADRLHNSWKGSYTKNNKISMFKKIRIVFLRDAGLYLFSAEYDFKNEILYFYITYLELERLYGEAVQGQARLGFFLEYVWDNIYDVSEEDFIEYHSRAGRTGLYNLAPHIRYGYKDWYKFPRVLLGMDYFPSVNDKGGERPYAGYVKSLEPDDEHKYIHRQKDHALIIDMDYYYLIGPQAKLNSPLWEK